MKKLYYVINEGCDASTYGIIELTEIELEFVMNFITNLNKNSYYACMPRVSLREISWDDVKEVDLTKYKDVDNDEYVDFEDRFYYGDKIYTWKDVQDGYRKEFLPAVTLENRLE